MKKLFTSLAVAASLSAPLEVDAKLLQLDAPNQIEFTQATNTEVINTDFQEVQYQEDNSESTDEDVAAFGIGMLILLIIVLGVYFLPTTIAMMNGSSLVAAVFVINLLLGWTILGWIGALVMAVLPKQKSQTIIVQQSSDGTPNTATTPSGVDKIKY